MDATSKMKYLPLYIFVLTKPISFIKKIKFTRGEYIMKDITKILEKNPALAKEVAKLLKEELEMDNEVTETQLTLPEVSTGSNDSEVVPEAPVVSGAVDNVTVAGEGHSIADDLTAEDPITPEKVDSMVEEIPAEELEGEVEALEGVKADDEKEIEELDKVIEEATALKDSLKKRVVFTESIINKVNARILTEAAKLIASKKNLTEGKK
jgi:hypothetical protein